MKCVNCQTDICLPGNQCPKCKAGFKGSHCDQKDCESLNMCKNGGNKFKKTQVDVIPQVEQEFANAFLGLKEIIAKN